jgi:hypothetical protein
MRGTSLARKTRGVTFHFHAIDIQHLTDANQGQALRSKRARIGEHKGSVRVLCISRYFVVKHMTDRHLNLNSRSFCFRLPALNGRHKVALIRGKEILILLV